VVLCNTRRVFLVVLVMQVGVCLHNDARLRTIDSRPPTALGTNNFAVFDLLRILAEIPDIARLILRKIVECVLDQLAVHGRCIVNDHAGDAIDDLCLTRNVEIHDKRPVRALRYERRTGLIGKKTIVDGGREIVGIDGHGLESFPEVTRYRCRTPSLKSCSFASAPKRAPILIDHYRAPDYGAAATYGWVKHFTDS